MLDYSKELDGSTAIFCLSGRINLEKTAQLRRVFWECLVEDKIDKLIIDLTQVPLLDPSSISLLVGTKNVVSKYKACLILIGIQAANVALLEKTHLFSYFDIRADLAQAMLSKEDLPTTHRRQFNHKKSN